MKLNHSILACTLYVWLLTGIYSLRFGPDCNNMVKNIVQECVSRFYSTLWCGPPGGDGLETLIRNCHDCPSCKLPYQRCVASKLSTGPVSQCSVAQPLLKSLRRSLSSSRYFTKCN
ncbi:hypothetical protein PHET_02760 [Paragonimus heterotremus]|uniref:Uncharacterized protein n=1 Tax=Paragonimus heterotremus TaxID=100268 RepID=A0A8J4SRW2_9TREM|nr:hypothetical protein PHET_02760 [Paragonimus heterotremus]